MEVRCQAKKHAELGEYLEVKCSSRFCGAGPGKVVIHRFDRTTGELIETQMFKEPARKEQVNAAYHNPASVRSA